MPFSVGCSVDGCTYEAEEVNDLERVFDLQDSHTDQFGKHHILEFERLEVSLMSI